MASTTSSSLPRRMVCDSATEYSRRSFSVRSRLTASARATGAARARDRPAARNGHAFMLSRLRRSMGAAAREAAGKTPIYCTGGEGRARKGSQGPARRLARLGNRLAQALAHLFVADDAFLEPLVLA